MTTKPYGTFDFLVRNTGWEPWVDGIAAILNSSPDGDLIEVREIAVAPTGQANSREFLTLSVQRISDSTGGTAVTAFRHDTDNAALPSQVEFRLLPTSYVEVSRIRRKIFPLSAETSQPIANLFGGHFPVGLNSAARERRCSNVIHFGRSTDLEPLILREGEGVALVMAPDAGDSSIMLGFALGVMVTDDTGKTYVYRTREGSTPELSGQAIFTLMNRSGSGVVLKVICIEIPCESHFGNISSSAAVGLRLCRIDGVRRGSALSSPTVSPHDTAAPLPAGVVSFFGNKFLAALGGTNEAYVSTWWTDQSDLMTVASEFHRLGNFGCRQMYPTNVEPGATTSMAPFSEIMYRAMRGLPGIIIQPGKGFAVLMGNDATVITAQRAVYSVRMTFILHRTLSKFSHPEVVHVG